MKIPPDVRAVCGFRRRASPLLSASLLPTYALWPRTRPPRTTYPPRRWRRGPSLSLQRQQQCRVSSSRSSHRHLVDPHGRNPDSDGHALSFLAAYADPLIEFQIVPDHADMAHGFRTIADQRRIAHGPGDLAVLDQIALRCGEDEIAARNIHLSAAEIGAVKSFRHRPDD